MMSMLHQRGWHLHNIRSISADPDCHIYAEIVNAIDSSFVNAFDE